MSRDFGGYRRGLDYELGLLNSYRSVTTSNYNRFTNSRTSEFTRAHIYVLSACCVFTSLPVTADVPLLWVPELFPCLSHQLIRATAHNV
jgi:hypothetical protein